HMPGVSDSLYHGLMEWRPTGFGLDGFGARGFGGWLLTFQGRFWFATALAGLGVRRAAHERAFLLALAAVAFARALRSRRSIPLFGVCAPPIAALGVAGCLELLRAWRPRLAGSRARAFATAATFAAALWMWRDVGVWPDLLGQWSASDLYPRAA